MTLLNILVEGLQDYKSCNCNLRKHNLKIGNQELVKQGDKLVDNNYLDGSELKKYGIEDCKSNPWEVIETLYQNYKFSIPNKKYKKHQYFKAYDDLTFEQEVLNMNRYEAQNLLEGYVLIAGLSGLLEFKGWFHQGQDKDLVVLKAWTHK